MFGFFRDLGEGLNTRHKLKPENWSREAKAQLIGGNRDVSLHVCGVFMYHPGQGRGGAGDDKGGEGRKSGRRVEFGGLVEETVNPYLQIEPVGMRRDRTGIRHSVPVQVGSPGSLNAVTTPLPEDANCFPCSGTHGKHGVVVPSPLWGLHREVPSPRASSRQLAFQLHGSLTLGPPYPPDLLLS